MLCSKRYSLVFSRFVKISYLDVSCRRSNTINNVQNGPDVIAEKHALISFICKEKLVKYWTVMNSKLGLKYIDLLWRIDEKVCAVSHTFKEPHDSIRCYLWPACLRVRQEVSAVTSSHELLVFFSTFWKRHVNQHGGGKQVFFFYFRNINFCTRKENVFELRNMTLVFVYIRMKLN